MVVVRLLSAFKADNKRTSIQLEFLSIKKEQPTWSCSNS